MKTVGPNLLMLISRVALLALFGYMYQWPLEKLRNGQFQENELIFWVGLFAYTIFPCYLIWTLLGVMWVRIDHEKGIIHFCYIFRRINVAVTDISGYFRTTHKTKIASYNGLLVKLNSAKVIEVSSYNLKSVDNVEKFLNQNKVALWGDKDSWFPYKRKI